MALGALAHSQAISEAWRQVYTGDFIPVAKTSVWQPLPDSSQNIYLIAEMQNQGSVLLVYGVLCVDAAGDIRWMRRFPERVFEILLDPQGNLQAFAYDGIYTFRPSGELIRREPLLMRGSYPGINAAAIDAAGNRYVLFGWLSATLICLSPDGQLVWQQEYPDLHPLDVFVDGSGNILVALGMPDSSGSLLLSPATMLDASRGAFVGLAVSVQTPFVHPYSGAHARWAILRGSRCSRVLH